MELVKDVDAFLYPVGRLDVETSGLLILTNDGEFTKLVSHPSHGVEKTYLAVIKGRIKSADLAALSQGIELEDGVTAPAKVRLISSSPRNGTSTVELTIHEGRKRQVRRMFAVVGYKVEKLTRTKIGNLDLKGLREGEYRPLTRREISELRGSDKKRKRETSKETKAANNVMASIYKKRNSDRPDRKQRTI